jgi:hypothetical protein
VRAGFKGTVTPKRRARRGTTGLEVDISVLQHTNVPPLLAHVLTEIGCWLGGACLAIGVAEAAMPLTAARPATKDTMGL